MSESISVWTVRTNGFGGGKVYTTDITIQQLVLILNYPRKTSGDLFYFVHEENARAHLADYIAKHPGNQPVKEASE